VDHWTGKLVIVPRIFGLGYGARNLTMSSCYLQVQRTPEFAKLCSIDSKTEKVAGVIWYGFASGGLLSVDPKYREKGVDEVLFSVP
jgi:hypothetical protein